VYKRQPLHCGAVVASRCGRGSPACLLSFNPLHCGAVVASRPCRLWTPPGLGFNPLHCGAVVASLWLPEIPPVLVPYVSIPFIAGQWSLLVAGRARRGGAGGVSIPFIAGQWSLPRGDGPPAVWQGGGFNPLHCGAVVASRADESTIVRALQVSIPFIAGQWSLRAGAAGG